ncbi:MAG: Sensor protein PhoQ (EC [uncultured Thiotrichaceae bacterium]|uniref:histidine kinase n=1 Tax=uncultured Thiotrichaceae bacterium TaxID=298394 RepID=A0A6S6T6W1_9GAMM|nr:MAG: Sensor protein PhoQ (EC [uncultured Thiotrichaceae bacterium]
MKSLERELQRNLAIILVGVMLGIWLTGSLMPRQLPNQSNTVTLPETCVTEQQLTACTPFSVHKSGKSEARPPRRFTWLFPILAGCGVVLILVVQGIVIRRTFRRLDRIRAEVRELEAGHIKTLSEQVPVEIHPIIHEFNHVLQLMEERLERSRNSLGNLAHALKGPLNLLIQELDQQADSPAKQRAMQQAERVRQLTQRELKRARMAGLGNTTQRFSAQEDLPVLTEVLARVHRKPVDYIQLDIAAGTERFGDREDMLELLGNLLDNACKWADRRVSCRIEPDGQRHRIVIEDDGPGCTETELQQMTERGTRLDESVEGYGLGLAICKDIIKLYDGQLKFGHSQRFGGLSVEVVV